MHTLRFELSQDLVHLFGVVVGQQQFQDQLAPLRTAGLGQLVEGILEAGTYLFIPTPYPAAVRFMPL